MNNKVDREKLILQSALKNFNEDGYDRATITNIAKKAGVGKGTIYEYFSSKEELFYKVVLTGLTHACDELMLVMNEPGTVCSKVKRLYEKHAQLLHSESDLRAIMLNDFGKIPKDLFTQMQKIQKSMLMQVEKMLKEAIDKGELTNIHPGIAASIVLHGIKVIHTYQPREQETYEDIVEEQLKILFNGINCSSTQVLKPNPDTGL